MADLINVRPRPGVRINLHIADIFNIMKQPEVIISFSNAELNEMIEIMREELEQRK